MQSRDLGETLWILRIDNSFRVVGGGVGMVLQSSKDLCIAQVIKFAFVASNNEAEYKVVLLGL